MNLKELYNINLIDLFSKYTNIVHKSQKYWCCCPLHIEKTPSCTVNEKRFYCFGCGENGNIITFYMKYFTIELQPAITRICQDFNIKIEYNNTNNELLQLLNAALEIYQKNLHYIKDYINKRHITIEMIEIFKLGYSYENTIIPKLIQKGYNLSHIQDSGILHGNSLDALHNRLIFPLINKNNDIIGFSGRAINNNILPKYLNCRDTILFNKSNYLYGEHLLTFDQPYSIIVEGYLDVISAYSVGIRNIVSIMGTSMHEYSIATLFNYTNTIYIMMDNDDAGINAIKRNLPLLCKYITNIKRIYICSLNNYKDIDEIVTSSIDAKTEIQKTLLNAVFILDWALNNAISINMNNMTQNERIITRIEYMKTLCKYIQNDTTRSIYLNYYMQKKDINKHKLVVTNPEQQLLSLLLQNSDIIPSFLEELLNIQFKNQTYEEIRLIITLNLLYKNIIDNILLILNAQFPAEIEVLINNVENKYIIVNRSFTMQYVKDLFKRIMKINIVE